MARTSGTPMTALAGMCISGMMPVTLNARIMKNIVTSSGAKARPRLPITSSMTLT